MITTPSNAFVSSENSGRGVLNIEYPTRNIEVRSCTHDLFHQLKICFRKTNLSKTQTCQNEKYNICFINTTAGWMR
jgi:hypothetical protein